jgi:hypothetical protein
MGIVAYYDAPDGSYCTKVTLPLIDYAFATQKAPDKAKWATSPQRGTIIDKSAASNVKPTGTGAGLPGRLYGGDH